MDLSFSGFPIGRVDRISLSEDGHAPHRDRGAAQGRANGCAPRASSPWSAASSAARASARSAAICRTRRCPTAPSVSSARRHPGRDSAHGGDAEEHAREHRAADRAGRQPAGKPGQPARRDRARGGRHGALGAVLGNDEDAKKVIAAIERANALLAAMSGVVAKTDQRVLGPGGVVEGTQRAVDQANAILGELRESLKRVDKILADAQSVTGNAEAAAGPRRAAGGGGREPAQGHRTHRRVNRKWPFSATPKFACPEPALQAGCSSLPPAAAGSNRSTGRRTRRRRLQSFQRHYFAGDTATAEAEFKAARNELARTGRADLVARAELVQRSRECALFLVQLRACCTSSARATRSARPVRASSLRAALNSASAVAVSPAK